MTPAQLLNSVRAQLYEQDADFWSDDELYAYMSQAETNIINLIQNPEEVDTVSVLATIPTVTKPSNALFIKSVVLGSNLNPLIKITQAQYNRMYDGGTPSTGTPEYYILKRNTIQLVPTPSANDIVRIYYVQEPPTISSASLEFYLDGRFVDTIQNYVMWRATLKDSDDSRATMFMQLYYQSLNNAQTLEAIQGMIDNSTTVREVV